MNSQNFLNRLTKKLPSILLINFSLLIVLTTNISANSLGCEDRYLTLINPVRERQYWWDKSLTPIKDQYEIIKNRDFAATWLIQYDVLKDSELVDELKKFNDKQEIGVFFEISEDLAYDAKVIYPHAKPWTDPSALFLSGYSQSERVKFIDKIFLEFKNIFGRYPKSVGAWWMDSYSLKFIEEKYGIDTVLIVADQKTTDKYGVWGQWWGVPYYPSNYNILKPASDANEVSDFVVLQWAQRDFTKAYGNDYIYSNYSLQANDYVERGLNTNYFKYLTSEYLSCELPIGQITVGLETGIEGVAFFDEYQKQMDYLSDLQGIKSLTMSEFFTVYKNMYTSNPETIVLQDNVSEWILTKNERSNDYLNENINYKNVQSFSDYFLADNNSFLNRRLNDGHLGGDEKEYFELFYLPFIVTLIYALTKKQFRVWFSSAAFMIAAYGSLLRSEYRFGWKVFYGPVVSDLELTNLILATLLLLVFFAPWNYLSKRKWINSGLFYLLLPLSFAVDTFLKLFRYTNIENKHYLGVVFDTFNFYGVNFPDFGFFSLKLPHVVAGSLLKFDMEKVWSNIGLSLFVYPVFHVVLALILTYVIGKVKTPLKITIISLLIIFFLAHLYWIFTIDPRAVVKV